MRIDIHQFCGSQMLFFCRAQCVSNDQDIHVLNMVHGYMYVPDVDWIDYHWNRSPRKKCKYDLIGERRMCVMPFGHFNLHLIFEHHTIALFLCNNLNTSSLWLCWAAEYITLGVGARDIQKTAENSKQQTQNKKHENPNAYTCLHRMLNFFNVVLVN